MNIVTAVLVVVMMAAAHFTGEDAVVIGAGIGVIVGVAFCVERQRANKREADIIRYQLRNETKMESLALDNQILRNRLDGFCKTQMNNLEERIKKMEQRI